MLSLTLAPSVPTSLRNIPLKYNLIIRLWTHAFHRLLESLRRAAMPPSSSTVALEHLQVCNRLAAHRQTEFSANPGSFALPGIHLLCIHLLRSSPRGTQPQFLPYPMDRSPR